MAKQKFPKKVKMIDPPNGWKYGFPKRIPDGLITREDFDNWLVSEGYPKKDLKLAKNHSRFWYEDESISKE